PAQPGCDRLRYPAVAVLTAGMVPNPPVRAERARLLRGGYRPLRLVPPPGAAGARFGRRPRAGLPGGRGDDATPGGADARRHAQASEDPQSSRALAARCSAGWKMLHASLLVRSLASASSTWTNRA